MHRLLLLIALAFGSSLGLAEPLQFNRDIRPILSENCFACHGFDEETREADLRLDEPEGAFKADKHGTQAIVPGDPDKSLIWEYISSDDEDEVMPPPDSNKKLTPEQKDTIRQWIEEGAKYQKHWAFVAPVRNVVPAGEGGEIDRFIAAPLRSAGGELSPEAERSTLIRRVSMALRGLPPTLEEVNEFLVDTEPQAYERMVDRFLASPHYGEEMGRHWLDVARYADTHGLHLDNERQMWSYRDWVVEAFNRNLPYNEFVIEQIAGDLLPDPRMDQLIATGFNRCNVTTSEGGSIKEEYVFRYAVDRASTTAQAFLGLTAGCAVCHDHKYDPITTKDFYSLYAFFHSNADPAMDGNAILTKPVIKVKPSGYDQQMAGFSKRETEQRRSMDETVVGLVYQDPADQIPRPPASEVETLWFEDGFPEGAKLSASGHALTLVDSPVSSGKKSLKRSGVGISQDSYSAGAAALVVPREARFFVDVYLDPADPPKEVMIQFHGSGWQHRALWGQDIIEFGAKGTSERFAAGELPEAGKWVTLEVPGSSMGLEEGTKVTGYAFTVHGGTAYFDKLLVKGVEDPASSPGLSFAAWRADRAGKDVPVADNDLKTWIKEGPDKARTPEELTRLRHHYLQEVCATTKSSFATQHAELAKIQKERAEVDAAVPSTFIFRDLPQPRESFVMVRGQYDQPGEKVEPNTPVVLPPLKKSGERATRLDLAKWLVDSENPLTARVAVNRLWQQMFGSGLVRSSHDFGTQGDLPSHPELLDWLAVGFQESGWDVKRLVRLMLTSATFRQESRATPEMWTDDPHNRGLARGPRIRLDAEQLRDQALFVSGLIQMKRGGRGVNPYQPKNIWEPVGFGNSNTRYYKQDSGEALYRRSIYTFLKRTAPHPMMSNFDAPNREQSCILRERSNTPLQALQLMNDVQHFEAARHFAGRMMAEAATPTERIGFAYRSLLARSPVAEETSMIMKFYERELVRYRAAPEEARKAIRFGESTPPDDIDEADLAAWTMVANLILNLDEVIVRN